MRTDPVIQRNTYMPNDVLDMPRHLGHNTTVSKRSTTSFSAFPLNAARAVSMTINKPIRRPPPELPPLGAIEQQEAPTPALPPRPVVSSYFSPAVNPSTAWMLLHSVSTWAS